MSKPFIPKILSVLKTLNYRTEQSYQFSDIFSEYYVSRQDFVLNYTDADSFCQLWGGQLLRISDEFEY